MYRLRSVSFHVKGERVSLPDMGVRLTRACPSGPRTRAGTFDTWRGGSVLYIIAD